MVGVALHIRRQKQSPWSSTSEKGIDSLAVWLIPTLGHPNNIVFFVRLAFAEEKKKYFYFTFDKLHLMR